ncbi:MAG TPA: twin-arginine translocase TatA/TatE family subunit [Thermoanaerobaculia bacterium]|nr:twin-arginine translocase TatA/TatE family subunit [Thermoanaerobaculia bacterium]
MGSLGIPEILFILVIALLLFGPKRLPEIGRTLGKGMAEFRKASNDLKRTINLELAIDEDSQTARPRRLDLPSIAPMIQSTMSGAAVEERPAPPETLAQTAQTAPTPPPISEAVETAEAETPRIAEAPPAAEAAPSSAPIEPG